MSAKNHAHLQRTRLTVSRCTAVMAVIALLVSTITSAENIKMYRSVPSATEMANLLFPGAQQQSQRPKTRSISFDPIDNAIKQTPLARKSVGIGLPVQFDFNSDEISNDSRPYLDELAQMLLLDDLRDKKIIIEGHTDAIGDAQYNQQLSIRRARAVKQYLNYKYGIDRNRLVVSGKGEYAPLSGHDPFDAMNRRVEIHKFQ